MNQLLTVFNGATIFSKIDLCGAYNLLRIKEGDEHLAAFRTKYGSYEYLFMPFGFTNAAASFKNLVNDIFSDFSDIFVVVYFNDIMVFSSSEEEHVKHVASVLQRLRDNNLFSKSSKCVFHASSVEYLGYVVSSDCLKMYSSKFQQMLNWPQPKNNKALQSFLGIANLYCCFIKSYSKKIAALTSLLKKDSPFIFNEEALSQFQILKEAFTTSPILSHFNPSLPTIVETDACDCALGAVLSQVNDSGKHPIAFDSRKLLPAELNYEIHNKELLGIVWALKRWRSFLLSLSNSFEVLTDHSSLQYFMSSKFLTHRQALWAEFLSEFNFTITYRPGRMATLPDALSRWDNMYPERGVNFISKNPQNFHQVIKQDGIQESRFFLIKVDIFSDLVENIQKEVWQDKYYKEIHKQLASGESVTDFSLESQAKLLFNDGVVIPRNEEIHLNILQKSHDSPLAGHPGQEKTLKLFKRDFYWAGINKFIKDYVSSCQQFSRNKKIHHKNFGLLKPLQIPCGSWNSFSMDFITELPLSNNFDSILVVVDRFSKMEIFIPTYGTITSLELAQILISHVFSKHGLPVSIVSYRGSLFVSSFWTQLCQQLKISRDLSTAFHPERDGQTERVNQILEQYLWITFIIKEIPFLTIYGRNLSFDLIHISQDSPSGKVSTKLKSVWQVFKEELESEIRRFKNYEYRNRSVPPDFQPGDKVWLASKNIKTKRLTKKLSERWLGPFEVIKKIGSHAYHLKLPQQWNSVHPLFHVSLLEPVKQSSIPNFNQLPPPPVLVEEEEEWEVAQVLDSKLKRGQLWYLVEWKGFSEDPERTTWEPASNLTNSPNLVRDFHSLYPDNPGSNTSRV
ncbi:hypothetical protein O181_017129 [Austropuccinia psidii MF-1]|uniref:Reverse transcriptase n=1 Tax=Austropuccinia psidii MF-1 TaxID=1389203 RepID=A0A9Q3GSG9_9BASI|nr:hypothetical protein [Austropuccinia psidii MF-1]